MCSPDWLSAITQFIAGGVQVSADKLELDCTLRTSAVARRLMSQAMDLGLELQDTSRRALLQDGSSCESPDFTLGLGAVYLGTWNANLAYVRFLGREGSTLDNASNAQFRQALKDRDFLSLSLRTTF